MNFKNRDSELVNSISNKDYVSDINYSIQYTRWFLRLIGIWPLVMSNPTSIEKNIAKILLPICSIFMIILVVPIIAHIILQRADRPELIILLAPITFQITNVINHFLIILRSNSIKFCMQHMEKDWRRIGDSTDREFMRRNVRLGHALTIACTLFMYSNVLSYHLLVPILSGQTINELNETVKPLTFPGTDIFFDPQPSVIYEIVFGSNLISIIVHYAVKTAVCNLVVVLVSHVCGQIKIVVRKIENLVDQNLETDRAVSVNKIRLIVQNHVRLLKFANHIEVVLREVCLMEVIASIIIICLVEYCCITEWNNSDRMAILTYSVLLVTFVLNLFLYCQFGEIFKEQCQEVGKAAYMIEWYRLPGKTSLALIMIIIMGNYPRKLTAGKIMELSIASFANSMRTSFAYLNMLRTVA